MKKIAFATTLGIFACITSAQANFYVQGDVGYVKNKFSVGSEHLSKAVFTPRISAGYDFGDIRVSLDYTKNTKVKLSNESLSVASLGTNVFYDFPELSKVTPYVGARIATNWVSYEGKEFYQNPNRESHLKVKQARLGYGLLTGITYNFDKQIALNAGLEYGNLGKVDSVKLHQYGATVGVRFSF